MNNAPSPRERRMGEQLTTALADDPNAPLMSDEEIRDRQRRNFAEWKMAFGLAKTDKQKQMLLDELRDGKGTDFPGDAEPAAGFSPVLLDQGRETPFAANVEPQGFQPVIIPRTDSFSRVLGDRVERTGAEMTRRDLEAGTGVLRVPPIGPNETPGGAATGMVYPRVAGEERETQRGGPLARIVAETTGAAAGGGLGSIPGVVMRSPGVAAAGMRVGESVGAYLGSRFAESFDPTEDPHDTASIAAGWTLGTGLVASGGAQIFRRMLGKPTEAGKKILEVMEKEGKVPPPGAVMPETSIAQAIQSIGAAEAFFGRHVKEHILETGRAVSRDLRHYVSDFFRVKKGADRLFKQWDETVAATMGNARGVHVKAEVFDALETAVKEWERLGLTSKVDNTLLDAVKYVQNQRAAFAEAGKKLDSVTITLSEAEAARTFLYNRARAMAGSTTAEKGAVAGQDFARAYRSMADDVGGAIDDAIDVGVKNGKIPVEARAALEGGRQLWRQWKQGETIMEELLVPMKSAIRGDKPLKASAIEEGLKNIENLEQKLGRPVVSTTQKAHLAGIQRALKAVEESGKSSQFTFSVRTGQLAALTYGVATSGGDIGNIAGTGAIALSPAAFTFLITNPKAASLLIRGLRLEPGTAGAARVTRELITLLAKEGHADIQREPVAEE